MFNAEILLNLAQATFPTPAGKRHCLIIDKDSGLLTLNLFYNNNWIPCIFDDEDMEKYPEMIIRDIQKEILTN